jgi:hypothetical protein
MSAGRRELSEKRHVFVSLSDLSLVTTYHISSFPLFLSPPVTADLDGQHARCGLVRRQHLPLLGVRAADCRALPLREQDDVLHLIGG